MGKISELFANLTSKNFNVADNLYLDLNHAIYETVRAVLDKRQEAVAIAAAAAAAAAAAPPAAEGAAPEPAPVAEELTPEQLEKAVEEDVYVGVCELIDGLVQILRPRLLLYIGIDGS
jgi:5'-3' exonuclease